MRGLTMWTAFTKYAARNICRSPVTRSEEVAIVSFLMYKDETQQTSNAFDLYIIILTAIRPLEVEVTCDGDAKTDGDQEQTIWCVVSVYSGGGGGGGTGGETESIWWYCGERWW